MNFQQMLVFLSALQNQQNDADLRIHRYQEVADQIIEYSLNGPGKDQSYNRLAYFTDKFGPRLAGTQNLEDAIDYVLEALEEDGLDTVHGETAIVTHWERNKEYAKLVSPREANIAILGQAPSVSTDGELTADVIVVRSFDELHAVSDQVSGKIVVYNQDYEGYEESVGYRVQGASEAARYGAVAALVRSITDQSIYSPHAGYMAYEKGIPKIPEACITVEDAEMLDRMQARGEEIRITLYMEAKTLFPSFSRNVVAEIEGSEHPEQVVIVSGHIDSWDVGQGAMDDGGGSFVSWQALSIIRHMGLKPKRTIRLVMWTQEEYGPVPMGSYQYYLKHKDEAGNLSAVFESDAGVFTPYGVGFTGSRAAKHIMKQIGKLLSSINATEVQDGGEQPDTTWWEDYDVPLGTILTHNEDYFWYHHTEGDTMTVMDPVQMNLCSAVFAVYAYVLADIDELLPR